MDGARTRLVVDRWPLWVGGLVLAALSLAVIVHPEPLVGEVAYVRWLQRRGEPVPTIAAFLRSTTGTLGNSLVVVAASVPLVRRFGRPAARAALIALVAMLLVQPAFKELVDRPRPTEAVVEVRAEHSSMSFPSGHSLGTTTVWGAAGGLAWVKRRRGLASLAAVPVVATGLASGVQGVHWPSDALAGTVTGGFAAAAIVAVLAQAADDRRRSVPRRSARCRQVERGA